jgi:hypothetical protein
LGSPGEHDIGRYVARHVLAANQASTTTEARVAMALAGIEYLAWVDQVLRGGGNRREHKERPAHERIRELLVAASIPIEVPVQLSTFAAQARAGGEDGPAAITWMRNRLMHAKDPSGPYRLRGHLSDVWLLSLTYLELLLLKRIGYVGMYQPRWPLHRFEADVDPVPWAPRNDDPDV